MFGCAIGASFEFSIPQEVVSLEFEIPGVKAPVPTPTAAFKFTFVQGSTDTTTSTKSMEYKNVQTASVAVPCNCPVGIPDNSMCDFEFDYQQSIGWEDLTWKSRLVLMLKTGKPLFFPVGGKTKGSYQSIVFNEAQVRCNGGSILPPPAQAPAPPKAPALPPAPAADVCSFYSVWKPTGEDMPYKAITGDSFVFDTCSCVRACKMDSYCTGVKFCSALQQSKTCLRM